MSDNEQIVIIGAGPAGLTAAYELQRQGCANVLILEEEEQAGGISKTINFNGWRMDIGGHRFFSKSKRILDWWNEILPMAGSPASDDKLLGRSLPFAPNGPDPEEDDLVMLVRSRKSSIIFERHFYDYPLRPTMRLFSNLGLNRSMQIGLTAAKAKLFPRKPERHLEDYLVNHFGTELYATFFRDYTEKVWGRKCTEIDPSWGRQRIKGLSLLQALLQAFQRSKSDDIEQKSVNTSLINFFLYPKYGPGFLWERAAVLAQEAGAKIAYGWRVVSIHSDGSKVRAVTARNLKTGEEKDFATSAVFSTMPVKDLVAGLTSQPPQKVIETAATLPYRDFITAGVLLRELGIRPPDDNWIYVQEKDLKLARIQFFKNWSPYMVQDRNLHWLGLEYFSNEGDALWTMSDGAFLEMCLSELEKLNILANRDAFMKGTVVRVRKAYPAYWDGYDHFDRIKDYLNSISNLYCIGRNGMHRYNNMDHSMLSAMTAVDVYAAHEKDKSAIWDVNIEENYHESND